MASAEVEPVTELGLLVVACTPGTDRKGADERGTAKPHRLRRVQCRRVHKSDLSKWCGPLVAFIEIVWTRRPIAEPGVPSHMLTAIPLHPEHSLAGVDPLIARLKDRIRKVDGEIVAAVRLQVSPNTLTGGA